MNTFGGFLYSLRKEKGMTQAELAEALGVTNKAVSKWETGEAMPETGLLLPMSRIFGVTVDELLDGKRQGAVKEKTEYEEIDKHIFTRGNDEEKTFSDRIGGVICTAVFFVSIAAYLILGACYGLWHPYWVIIPCSAMLCGIIGIIFDLCNGKKRAQKIARGENPYTGAICGLVILSCIIAYLLCGAIANLWHPHWIIVVAGAVICGLVGALSELISHKNKGE